MLPEDKHRKVLTPEYVRMSEKVENYGLMQFMDSVTVAGNAKCISVGRQKIEALFNALAAE